MGGATHDALRMAQGIVQGVQVRSQLLPILRTPLLGDLLAWLYLHPEELWSVTDLAGRFDASASTVSREADRLVHSHLITEQRRGNLRLLRANLDGPLARPLTDLLTLTYGPKVVLGEALARVDGVDEAFIYGSWAARYSGEMGPTPRDVDVLVIGEADDDDLFEAARVAERRLGREVNVRRVAPRVWHGGGDDPFLTSVRSRPLVSIELAREPA